MESNFNTFFRLKKFKLFGFQFARIQHLITGDFKKSLL